MGVFVIIILSIYFVVIFTISRIVDTKSKGNVTFFTANKKSPWYIVSIGMVGASISGVTFISVPGMVVSHNMSYMQMVLGFIIGYLIVAYVLLPIYYKLNLISIYEYLKIRLGEKSYKTGASFFILSKIIGSSAKLYIIAIIVHSLIAKDYNISFGVTVCVLILFVWLYTLKSGVKTIVWTDTVQTIFLILALVLIIYEIIHSLGFSFSESLDFVSNNNHSQIFFWDNWKESNNFFKQFLSGILIVIVMTGLDQDMMQKNLTCKNLKYAQKNMLWYGSAFIPLNLLFLSLGVLLLGYASKNGITLPVSSDQILPFLATEYLGKVVLIFFIIGIISASFSSIDSAMTSITTSIYIDILGYDVNESQKMRKLIHISISFIFILTILIFKVFEGQSILIVIYKIASLTYGPLLGMFAFSILRKDNIKDSLVPLICILSPIISIIFEYSFSNFFDYNIGYEILLINALITFMGLYAIKTKTKNSFAYLGRKNI